MTMIGDPSEWGQAAGGQAVVDSAQKAQQFGFEMGQRQAGIRALRGVDISDPASVGRALNGLTSVGLADQAKALTDLAQTRAVNTATLPIVQTGAAQAESQLQQGGQQQQQFDNQRYGSLLNEAHAALDDIQSTSDPDQRAQKVAQWRAHFQNEGVPQERIDAVLGGGTDDATLKGHQANLAAEIQNFQVTGQPGYQQSAGYLNSGLANPVTMAAFDKAGLPLGQGMSLAEGLTAPARAGYTNLALVPPTAGATTAATIGAQAANAGNLTTIGRAETTGAAEGMPTTIRGPGNQEIPVTWSKDAQGRWTATQAQLQQAGTGGAPAPIPAGGPTAGSLQSQQQSAQNITNDANSFENYAAGTSARKATIDNLRMAADGLQTGPQAPFWRLWGQFKAEYPNLPLPGPQKTETANYEEVHKLAQQLLTDQKARLGLPNTNMSLDLAAGASPGEENSPEGIKRLLAIPEGFEDYANAQNNAWANYQRVIGADKTGDKTAFHEFQRNWNNNFSPRVFQAAYMNPQQRALVRASVGPKKFDAMTAIAQRNGWLGAQPQ